MPVAINKIKLAPSYNISFLDYPDRSEWCTTLYTLGCPHMCSGCHNEILKNKDYPEYDEFTVGELYVFLSELAERNQSNNFSIMGGEPLAPWNVEFIAQLLFHNTISEEFNFCIYTGYDIDYVMKRGIYNAKYLKTGLYDSTKPTPKRDNFCLGSTNQTIYDENFKPLTINGVLYE